MKKERRVFNFAWSWSFFMQVCSILSAGSDLFIQLYSKHGIIICLPLIWNIQVLFVSILKVCQSGKIAVPNTLRTNLFSGNWIGFLANYMQLFQSISICEIKCCREHIKSNKVLFIVTQKSYSLFQSRGKIWLISFKTLGREWNLQGEKWAKFYPRSWDWTSGRIIWELIQVTFGHCPFDW